MRFRRVGGLGRAFRFGLLVLGLWLSVAIASFAQGGATILGTVSDTSGGAIPAGAIRIKNLETSAERKLVTDDAGRYDAAGLPVGRYELRAEKTESLPTEKIIFPSAVCIGKPTAIPCCRSRWTALTISF